MYKRSFTSLTIHVYLHASKTHAYTATLHSPCGDVLVASVREPNLSTCRALRSPATEDIPILSTKVLDL